MSKGHIKVQRVWRSQASRLALFIVTCPLSVWLSDKFPRSIIAGELFSLGDTAIILKLPLFWFIPAFVISQAIIKLYDVKYTVDDKGIESKIGILSLNQIITRIRYEDIRSIDSRQSISERMLGIGTLEIGTAASAGLEMSFTGIDQPLEVQRKIQAERDLRLRRAAKRQGSQEFSNLAAAGGE